MHDVLFTFLIMCSAVVSAILADLSATGTNRSCIDFSIDDLTYCFNWGYCCNNAIYKQIDNNILYLITTVVIHEYIASC